jgi:hypothetical protein
MEWTRAPANYRFVSKTQILQLSSGHRGHRYRSFVFLHNNDLANRKNFKRRDTAPRLEVERTPYGSLREFVTSGRAASMSRVYHLFSFHQCRSHQIDFITGDGSRRALPTLDGHMWVPMDDENTTVYNVTLAADEERPLTPDSLRDRDAREEARTVRLKCAGGLGRILAHRREVQRTKTFTGITGLNTQGTVRNMGDCRSFARTFRQHR